MNFQLGLLKKDLPSDKWVNRYLDLKHFLAEMIFSKGEVLSLLQVQGLWELTPP